MQNWLKALVFRKFLVVFISLIGLLTSIKLVIIYFQANFNPYALPSFCSINQLIDCDGVAQTTHSQFFGVPLALWGVFLYTFIIFLAYVDKLQKIKYLSFLEVFKNQMSYISSLGFIAFLISMILAGISIFDIKKICILCFFTYILNLVIAFCASQSNTSIINDIKTSIRDFVDAIKIKKYAISFSILCLFALCFLLYTNFSNIMTPQVKRINDFEHYKKLAKDNPFKAKGNVLGDKDAKLTLYIYTDYECPVCQIYDVILHRAANELSGFKIVHKNYPLDKSCNANLKNAFHENSCMMARYSIAAEKQGRLWDLNTELFEKQPQSEKEVIDIAKEIGFDIIELQKDANSAVTEDKLQDDIKDGDELYISGTPVTMINGKVYSGIKPYYELRELLLKAGAKDKK